MITDTLINRHLYTSISPRIKTALNYLAETDFSSIEPGRYDLDGNNLFVLVQKYDSIPKNQGTWECHRDYIDIQYIAEGVEQLGYNNVESMIYISDYNAEKDVIFLGGEGDYLTARVGTYCIFFPKDAHQPKIATGNIPSPVKKVVIKIKVD